MSIIFRQKREKYKNILDKYEINCYYRSDVVYRPAGKGQPGKNVKGTQNDISGALIMDIVIKISAVWLLIVNLYGFILCRIDKKRAVKHLWRIPEKRFFITAFLGGGPGVLAGMYTFRHKTKHVRFTAGIPAISIVEYVLIFLLLWKVWR